MTRGVARRLDVDEEAIQPELGHLGLAGDAGAAETPRILFDDRRPDQVERGSRSEASARCRSASTRAWPTTNARGPASRFSLAVSGGPANAVGMQLALWDRKPGEEIADVQEIQDPVALGIAEERQVIEPGRLHELLVGDRLRRMIAARGGDAPVA